MVYVESPAGTETIPGGTVQVGPPEHPGGLVQPPHHTSPVTGEPVRRVPTGELNAPELRASLKAVRERLMQLHTQP